MADANGAALVVGGREFSFADLEREKLKWKKTLSQRFSAGTVVSLESDFSPSAVGALLAMAELNLIAVPMTTSQEEQREKWRELAGVQGTVKLDANGSEAAMKTPDLPVSSHALYAELRAKGRTGLVLFSSGTSGPVKAAVHDFTLLREKFKKPRPPHRMAAFLHFDHIGGLNTLLSSLASRGTLILPESRHPDDVIKAVEKFRVEILPTSPTFLNLLLLSRAWEGRDLSSLKTITYGTEPMPAATLEALVKTFPNVRFHQTYGLSELGILRSKSRSSDSLWMKIGGDGFETRVRDGLLEIKAASAMLGYLNAPSPFTEDGWYRTGDAVETDGEWLRIKGRESEIINVGGEKVHPSEIEGVLRQMEGVEDVTVSGEEHPLTGSIVKARVRLMRAEDPGAFRKRMREFCQGRLRPFQIPQKVEFAAAPLHGERFKKLR